MSGPSAKGDNVNETLRLIEDRMSLRRYEERPIEPQHREAILHAAMRAPTAGNMMLYSIVEVADQTKRDRLAETCGHSFIAEAPFVLLFLADMQRWFDYYEAGDIRSYCENQGLIYRTPEASDLMMASCDALIAAQNAVVAAESVSVGSCYVGDIMGHAEVHRELFDLPPWAFPITLLTFGYYPGDLERRRTDRFDPQFIVFKDHYRHFEKADFQEMLAAIEAKFAGVMETRQMTLAQMTYRGFTLSKPRIEESRSVRRLLEDWGLPQSPSD